MVPVEETLLLRFPLDELVDHLARGITMGNRVNGVGLWVGRRNTGSVRPVTQYGGECIGATSAQVDDDIGSEFTPRDLDPRAYANDVGPDFSRPGKPTYEGFDSKIQAKS